MATMYLVEAGPTLLVSVNLISASDLADRDDVPGGGADRLEGVDRCAIGA